MLDTTTTIASRTMLVPQMTHDRTKWVELKLYGVSLLLTLHHMVGTGEKVRPMQGALVMCVLPIVRHDSLFDATGLQLVVPLCIRCMHCDGVSPALVCWFACMPKHGSDITSPLLQPHHAVPYLPDRPAKDTLGLSTW